MSSRELPEIVASSLVATSLISKPVGEVLRGFPPLSYLTCESGSVALLVDRIGSRRGSCESGSWCAVSSWRRSCGPGGASSCGGLEERK